MLGSFRPLATLIGWAVLPRLLAGLLLTATYAIFPIKPKTQQQALRHTQIAHTVVVGAYLLYTTFDAWQSLSPTYYDLLQLPPAHLYQGDGDAFDSDLKRSWKRVVLAFHPDKVGNSPEIQSRFVQFRKAYETLEDPMKRIAYDRFGPSLVQACDGVCKTARDYMRQGLLSSVGFYAVSFVMLAVLSVLKSLEFGQYWRYATLVLAMSIELSLLCRPAQRPSIWRFFPLIRRLPLFDIIVLLHQTVFSVNCALTQVGPLLFAASPFATSNKIMQQTQIEIAALAPLLQQTHNAIRSTEMELTVLASNEMRTVAANDSRKEKLSEAMTNALCELRLKGSKEGAEAWQLAITKAQTVNTVAKTPKEEIN